MKAAVLPCGDRALLVEVDDLDGVLALTTALQSDSDCSAEIAELIPAARTVLVEAQDGADLRVLSASVSRIAAATEVTATATRHGDEVVIQVRYDGPDLADVAAATGLSTADVIARHTGTPWRAAFGGFAPGFAYLVGGPPELQVPRRSESRTAVPAGSVALADGYSAVYPTESPGGWQLIGSSDAPLWDVDREPPALIRAGTLVRFVDVTGEPASGNGR